MDALPGFAGRNGDAGEVTTMSATVRLTMSQALMRYLTAQHTQIGNDTVPLIAGMFAIFGHGNVVGLGEALSSTRSFFPTYRAHNEQAMALAAIAFAKASRRRQL